MAAVVTKIVCKPICLGVQDTSGAKINFARCNNLKFIDTYPISLITPIHEFLRSL